MTQEQIEAKALEEYPVNTSVLTFDVDGNPVYHDTNEDHRAAFIKGCQYAATASAGLQWVKASEKLPDHTKTPLVNLKWNGKPDFMCWQVDSWCSEGDVIEDIAWQNIEWLDESSPAPSDAKYTEAQVREAMDLREASRTNYSDLGWFKLTYEDVISELNKKKS